MKQSSDKCNSTYLVSRDIGSRTKEEDERSLFDLFGADEDVLSNSWRRLRGRERAMPAEKYSMYSYCSTRPLERNVSSVDTAVPMLETRHLRLSSV